MRVEVVQCFGDWFDVFVECLGLWEQCVGGFIVFGFVGGDQVFYCGDELFDLIFYECVVEVDSFLFLFCVGFVDGDVVVCDGEGGLVDVFVDYVWFVECEVFFWLCYYGECV